MNRAALSIGVFGVFVRVDVNLWLGLLKAIPGDLLCSHWS